MASEGPNCCNSNPNPRAWTEVQVEVGSSERTNKRTTETNYNSFGCIWRSKCRHFGPTALSNPFKMCWKVVWWVACGGLQIELVVKTTSAWKRNASLRFCCPFWHPLDFEGVSKSIIFESDEHEITKKKRGVQEGVLKNMFWGWILDTKMGGYKSQKQAFCIIHVANYGFSES